MTGMRSWMGAINAFAAFAGLWDGCDKWLDADEPPNDLLSLLKPFSRDELAAYAVSTFVNNPRPGAEMH
jgi:hypothetical protein